MATDLENAQLLARATAAISSALGIAPDRFDIIAPNADDRSTWRVNFYDTVTPAQIQTAKNAVTALPATDTRLDAIKADANVANLANQIKSMTSAEIDAWFAANVTTLPQARAVMATIVKLLATKL